MADVALVLLTPIGLDAASWDGLGRADAITPEYPGHGEVPWDRAPYSLDDVADDVVAHTAGSLDVVGVSMGGVVAQHIALRHPQRVRSLLLACTTGACDRQTMLSRAEDSEGQLDAYLQPTLDRWFGAQEGPRRYPRAIEYAKRTLRALPAGAFAAGWRAMAEHSVLHQLGQVRAPVTCLAATDDAATPVSALQRLAEVLPVSRLVTTPGPHILQVAEPSVFAGELTAHLRWVAAGGEA